METVITFIKEHYEWIFSGIGVFVLALFIGKKTGIIQKQNVKDGSTGIQIGGNSEIKK